MIWSTLSCLSFLFQLFVTTFSSRLHVVDLAGIWRQFLKRNMNSIQSFIHWVFFDFQCTFCLRLCDQVVCDTVFFTMQKKTRTEFCRWQSIMIVKTDHFPVQIHAAFTTQQVPGHSTATCDRQYVTDISGQTELSCVGFCRMTFFRFMCNSQTYWWHFVQLQLFELYIYMSDVGPSSSDDWSLRHSRQCIALSSIRV